jgi:hypothetical protein
VTLLKAEFCGGGAEVSWSAAVRCIANACVVIGWGGFHFLISVILPRIVFVYADYSLGSSDCIMLGG